MKKINKLGLQYTLLQCLYWMSNCMPGGFVAVYLQSKGISTGGIGIITGVGTFLSLIVQPMITKMTESLSFLSVKRMIQVMMSTMAVFFFILTVIDVPAVGIYVLFMGICALNSCVPGMLSSLAMEYVNHNRFLDFSLSRGLGSLAYASCAVVLGVVTTNFDPNILGYIYVVLIFLFLVVLSSMQDMGLSADPVIADRISEKKVGIIGDVLKNKEFVCMIIAFFFFNAANASIQTYMVNVLRSLGGTETTLGIASFLCSGSELPIMIIFSWLAMRFSHRQLLKCSGFFFVLKVLIIMLAGSLPVAILGYMMQGVFFGLFTPATVYYVNDVLVQENRVKGQALFYMITVGIATGVGNFMGGWLIEMFQLQGMTIVCVCLGVIGFLILVYGMHYKEIKSWICKSSK